MLLVTPSIIPTFTLVAGENNAMLSIVRIGEIYFIAFQKSSIIYFLKCTQNQLCKTVLENIYVKEDKAPQSTYLFIEKLLDLSHI